jgi:hypothetical protein
MEGGAGTVTDLISDFGSVAAAVSIEDVVGAERKVGCAFGVSRVTVPATFL